MKQCRTPKFFLGGALLFLITCCCAGCAGGGTSGTGGGIVSSVQFSGVLKSSKSGPLAGVTVKSVPVNAAGAVGKPGKPVVTDSQGRFTAELELPPHAKPELDFEGARIHASIRLRSVPTGTAIVVITLRYDDDSAEVTEESVTFENENGEPIAEPTETDQ